MSVNMGLQLFPPPPKKASRSASVRQHRAQTQSPSNVAEDQARSPDTANGRQSAVSGGTSVLEPGPVHTVINNTELPRSYTSFSDAPTLVRSYSSASHRSISKPRIYDSPSNGGPINQEPIIRSIFPRYNPEIPLERQPYFPTQASPTHIPRTIISKAPYSPGFENVMGSPLSAPPTVGHFPRGVQDTEKTMIPSTTEELKELWKVTNGWRVSSSEGRSFCLKLTSSVDAPVHTLSSATQPFYTLRLDPTSTSALVTLSRQDPNKHRRGSSSPKESFASKSLGSEVLTTTLEESARRLPPNDGLVALLYPKAAADMALELASKANPPSEEAIMDAAENECGRLVWDDDGKAYYFVHPGMATPFKVQTESLPAWSRIEYTLEHPELPQNLVKLTRDGAGGGFLEVDTGVAARIQSFYIVDVAICAVLLVALAEEKEKKIERFEAPPVSASLATPSRKEKTVKVEAMEIDLESQNSIDDKKGKSKLPRPTRGILTVLFLAFRFVVWGITLAVNCAASIIIFVTMKK